jgi:hypothetical protein
VFRGFGNLCYLQETDLRWETDMRTPRFQAKGSLPPVCGVHNVPFVCITIPIDPDSLNLGKITCNFCSVSRKVVADPARQS